MPEYVNTTTLVLHYSVWPQPVGTVEMTRADYRTAAEIPLQYRKWNGSAVEEMTQPEKDVVDAAAATAAADAATTQAESDVDTSNDPGYQAVRAALKELNQDHNKWQLRIVEIEGALDDIKNTSGGSDNIRAAIPAPSQDVIDLGTAGNRGPATFTRAQNRLASNLLTDWKARITNKEGQI